MRDSVQKMLIFSVAMTQKMGEPAPFTQQFDEEMEDVPDSSVKAMDSITHFIDGTKYTLPLTTPLDPRILQAMAVFMGPGRGYFTKWLARKSRYEDLIMAKLDERDLPHDLMYLAMCESGFNPKAWSKASASGMWQFISGTGRRYGLHDDWWYDPRRDPMLATDAALDYLDDLHDEFQDWHLSMAAYNCGEGKIRKMLAQDSTRGYWKMPLPPETRFYVPKILAAMIIGHDPKRYGFFIDNP
ncbi:MAG: lytic transglycosylase domain-containing protein [Fibrobacteres bacterium]|nr:lytic transglycosylase domain-containing protein [Fibrobacterota bacterium]